MQENPAMAALGARSALPRRLAALAALAFALAAPAWTQSFLGTIRGTVVDPQGGAVAGATILIVDETTGVPRPVTTDAEGRYEATNLRPGSYRVEVVTTSFKKAERTGVQLKASAVALVEIRLELGPLTETVTVSAEALSNITLESQAIARGVDEQQIRDLPRNSRDIQSFLLLNPNVVGSTDGDPQFLGGRTYGVSYIQDGQSSTNAIFGTVGNSAPGLDSISEMQVLSNSYSAEYGGLAGVVVTTRRGGNQYNGTAFFDFNSNGLNALTYNQKEAGATRDDPNSDTHQYRWGASFGGPLISGKTFFHASYEGSNNKAIYGGGRANVPTAAMRNGDFSGTTIVIKDPQTGQPFPGNVIPAGRIDPAAMNVLDFFYPLPNQGTLASGMGVYQQFVPETQNRERADLRIDHEASKNDSLFLRGGFQHRDPSAIQFNGGNALTNLGIRDTVLNTATVVAGWTRIISNTTVNEFRAGYNYDKRAQRSTYNVMQVNSQLGLEDLDFITRGARRVPGLHPAGWCQQHPAHQHRRRRHQRGPHGQPELLLHQRQPELDRGRALLQGRSALDPQLRHRRPRPWRRRRRRVQVQRQQRDGQRPRRPPPRPPLAGRRQHDIPRRHGRVLQRFRGVRPGRLEGQQGPHGVPGPALRAPGRLARE